MLKNNKLKVSGLNDEYIVDDILLTPFPKNFNYEDNICVFYATLFKDKIERVYFIAEYFEKFNQDSLKNNSYKGFYSKWRFVYKVFGRKY